MVRDVSRTYTSTVRAEQAGATRQRIIDAAVDLLAGGDPNWSMAEVAGAAGTTVRTVYRHFASREDLVDGVFEWVNATIQAARPVGDLRTADDLAAAAPVAFGFIHEHERLYRLLLTTPMGQERHRRTVSRRGEELRSALADELDGLDPEQQQRLLGIVHVVASSQAALLLQDYWGLDAAEGGRAVGWAIRVLAAAAADPDWKEEL